MSSSSKAKATHSHPLRSNSVAHHPLRSNPPSLPQTHIRSQESPKKSRFNILLDKLRDEVTEAKAEEDNCFMDAIYFQPTLAPSDNRDLIFEPAPEQRGDTEQPASSIDQVVSSGSSGARLELSLDDIDNVLQLPRYVGPNGVEGENEVCEDADRVLDEASAKPKMSWFWIPLKLGGFLNSDEAPLKPPKRFQNALKPKNKCNTM